jgi:hypothetical protein
MYGAYLVNQPALDNDLYIPPKHRKGSREAIGGTMVALIFCWGLYYSQSVDGGAYIRREHKFGKGFTFGKVIP